MGTLIAVALIIQGLFGVSSTAPFVVWMAWTRVLLVAVSLLWFLWMNVPLVLYLWCEWLQYREDVLLVIRCHVGGFDKDGFDEEECDEKESKK